MSVALGPGLEHEHRLVDDGIEAFVAGAPDGTEQRRADLLRAVTLLRRHIYLEEEFLFPPLRSAGLMGPVMVMVREHGRMWPLLDRLEQQVDSTDAVPLCRELLELLAAHNAKEERILYPEADRLLPEAESAELVARLTTAQLPEGWVCQGAPAG